MSSQSTYMLHENLHETYMLKDLYFTIHYNIHVSHVSKYKLSSIRVKSNHDLNTIGYSKIYLHAYMFYSAISKIGQKNLEVLTYMFLVTYMFFHIPDIELFLIGKSGRAEKINLYEVIE